MEENKNIGTAVPEELSDKALEKAAGGCFPVCNIKPRRDYILITDFSKEFRLSKCTQCGFERYYRKDGNGPFHEISHEEFMWYLNAGQLNCSGDYLYWDWINETGRIPEMTDERKIDEKYLTRISGGTAQEVAELKEAILANPFLAGEWDETVGWAKRMGKPDDDITVAGLLLEDRFSFVRELSNDKPNEYQFTSWHEDIVRLIRNYRPNTD